MICGACHSNPQGRGLAVGAPLSDALLMPRPGTRRSDFAFDHTRRVDGATDDFYSSGDSRASRQQYTDFIREDMYRNGYVLMTCTSCHDPHGSDEPGQLRFNPRRNEGCTACHSDTVFLNIFPHLEEVTGEDHTASRERELYCTRCHMVRTAASGARLPELLDVIGGAPVQYYHGDTPGHRFNVPRLDMAAVQPSAATYDCALCHERDLPNP